MVTMGDLDTALANIAAIRTQIARGSEFCGYGPMTVAATGFLTAFTAAVGLLESRLIFLCSNFAMQRTVDRQGNLPISATARDAWPAFPLPHSPSWPSNNRIREDE
jgi:hypothetical protein